MKKPYLWSLVVLLVVICRSASGQENLPPPEKNALWFGVKLSGSNEVPPVATAAFGYFEFTYYPDTGQGDYKLSIWNISRVMKVQIHVGGPGAVGDGIISLNSIVPGFSGDGLFRGRIDINRDLVDADLNSRDLDQILELNSGDNLYVNVDTDGWPSGEIRGPFRLIP